MPFPRTLIPLLLITFTLSTPGCGRLGLVSDRSVMQKAQGFNDQIKPAVIHDADVDAYFQKVGNRIVAAAKQADAAHWGPSTHFNGQPDDWMYKGIQFHLVNSKTLNAFTTGGEHVYIYDALFQLCRNEDELAAVMSHEFGHVYSRHVQKGTERQYAALAAAALGGGVGYFAGGKDNGGKYAAAGAGLGLLAGNFANTTFTRGDEAQADECGFHFYCLAGWDPDRFGDFFQLMVDKGYDKGSEYLSDHPSLASRVKAARERAKAMPDLPPRDQLRRPEIAGVDQFRRYQQAAQRDAATTPDDTSLAQSKLLLTALPRSCLTPAVHDDQIEAQKQLQAELAAKQSNDAPNKAAPATAPAEEAIAPTPASRRRRHTTTQPPATE